MGIVYEGADFLANTLQQHYPEGGKALTLGKQDCFLTLEMLAHILVKSGYGKLVSGELYLNNYNLVKDILINHTEISPKAELAERGFITDNLLFGTLGFTIDCLDVSQYEGANIVHDLNLAATPLELHNQYDLIYDGGVLEHIFHVPNALQNIYHMLKVGGIIIHHLPGNNWVDHGFYQFPPTFFYDYYHACKFTICEALWIRHSESPRQPWMFMNYVPRSLDGVIGKLDDGQYMNWFVAKKAPESQYTLSVSQGTYARTQGWNG